MLLALLTQQLLLRTEKNPHNVFATYGMDAVQDISIRKHVLFFSAAHPFFVSKHLQCKIDSMAMLFFL